MDSISSSFKTLLHYGNALAAKVLARDNLHLAPKMLSRAVASRLRSGIRAMQAYLRRVLILMALELEHALPREQMERPIFALGPCKTQRTTAKTFTIFVGERAPPDIWSDPKHRAPKVRDPRCEIIAAPLLDQWRTLKVLLADPSARARRLAYTLARYRPSRLIIPNLHGVARRYGTEITAIYDCMAHEIAENCHARPPPLGPILRPPPRIRVL